MSAREASRDRVIVALDVPSLDAALDLDRRLGEDVAWVKVGLELFVASGPAVVTRLRERGRRVFLDLKLHDIPNTVAGAVRSASALGVELLTLHAEGGPAMMRVAREARDLAERGPRLLAVTVLTSLAGDEYPQVYRGSIPERVLAFAREAERCGMDGVVASSHEAKLLSDSFPRTFLRVIPGIRPAGSPAQDQARVATPAQAIALGATHLVVGRAVTSAPDPARAVSDLLDEVAEALARTARPCPPTA